MELLSNRTNLTKLLAFSVLWCCFSALASPYQIDDFSEKLSEEVDVSGGILIGYQVAGVAHSPNFTSLYVARPRDVNSFKLEINSIDGIYSAEMNVMFEGWEDSWTKISIPTEFSRALKRYSKDELIAYAYIEQVEPKGKRKKKFHKAFPTSWGAPMKVKNVVGKFFINSAESTASYKVGSQVIYCDKLKSKIQTAFNRTCKLHNLQSGDNLISMKTGRAKKYLIWLP